MMKYISKFLVVSLVIATSVQAQEISKPPEMLMPIECEFGWNCWIANYVDHDTSEGAKDYTCANQTYNTHKGTDFMIRNYIDMMGGVIVRAAADGVVLGMRDDMKDIDYRKRRKDLVAQKACGNGVRIDHGEGWITQYCHMRKNSLKIKKGDAVKAGDVLGFVGNSGLTMYPHLHFQVEYISPSSNKRRGAVVDPFVGIARNDVCKAGENPLWPEHLVSKLRYRPTNIIDTGFAATQPKTDGMVQGLYEDETLSVRAPQLLLWARILHVKKDDKVTFTITGPDGNEVFSYTSTIEKNQAHSSLHAGLRRPSYKWDEGVYSGEVKLQRLGVGIFKTDTKVSLR